MINSDPYIHENVICANIFIRKDGKYLMLKRSPLKKIAPNVVHPVGGKLDPDENPYSGAQREVLEEVGIKVTNMRLEAVLLEIKPVQEMNSNWLIFHFSADYASGEIKNTEEGKLVYLSDKEILKQELFPSVRQIIKKMLNPKDGTVFATFIFDKNGNITENKNVIDACTV